MNLALFDFDGTITAGDTFIPFLRFSARPQKLLLGGVVLSPLILGYKLGVVSGRAGRPLAARFAFHGEHAEAIRGLGQTYACEVLPGVVQRRALDRIEWHQRRGDVIVVVSGSLDVYLRHWCNSIGVDVICTQLEEKNGILTGRYIKGDCSRAEKLRRIRERFDLDRYSCIYAYGDTDDDREMLAIAHEKYYQWKRVGADFS